MPWNEIHFTTSEIHADNISEKLNDLGALAITYQDAGDQPIFEPAPETKRLWKETIVSVLFEIDQPLDPIFDFLKQQEDAGNIKQIQQKYIKDEDWERRCLDSFKPILFGKRLWVCPSWEAIPDPTAVNILLDPGLAFGTGSHPTTALCLEWLDENIVSQGLVIDYGCGSGILAIAALKLGAKRAIAIDNDPQALLATQENALRNGLSAPQLITSLPNADFEPADVLIANILAQPLIDLAPLFAKLTKHSAKIVLSGILDFQVRDVIAAYQPWFSMKPPVFREQWSRLEGVPLNSTT